MKRALWLVSGIFVVLVVAHDLLALASSGGLTVSFTRGRPATTWFWSDHPGRVLFGVALELALLGGGVMAVYAGLRGPGRDATAPQNGTSARADRPEQRSGPELVLAFLIAVAAVALLLTLR